MFANLGWEHLLLLAVAGLVILARTAARRDPVDQ
jgi:Sec-independent protein translocase protein TatA